MGSNLGSLNKGKCKTPGSNNRISRCPLGSNLGSFQKGKCRTLGSNNSSCISCPLGSLNKGKCRTLGSSNSSCSSCPLGSHLGSFSKGKCRRLGSSNSWAGCGTADCSSCCCAGSRNSGGCCVAALLADCCPWALLMMSIKLDCFKTTGSKGLMSCICRTSSAHSLSWFFLATSTWESGKISGTELK